MTHQVCSSIPKVSALVPPARLVVAVVEGAVEPHPRNSLQRISLMMQRLAPPLCHRILTRDGFLPLMIVDWPNKEIQ